MQRFSPVLVRSSDCAPFNAISDLSDVPGDAAGFGGVDETIEHFSGVPRAPEQSFVGRDQALSELNLAIVRSLQGHGSLVVISGEPGIGKTRLMAEFAGLAQRAGVISLWGNCWEGGDAPVFWPWIQVLRAFGRTHDPHALQRALGHAAADLQTIVPEFGEHAGGKVGNVAIGAASHEARFRLFDAVAGFLRRAAQARPLLVNLDNLHAADEGSLQLLRFVATDLWDARVLLVASYRESDATHDTPLWRLLGELGTSAQRIQLLGLGPDDVTQLIRELGGKAPEPEFSRALHARTQGNPFYLREVLRLHAAGDDALDSVPDSVAQVIERRLSRVGAEALELLHGASVFGSEFSVELLSAACDRSPEQIRALFPALLSSRLLARDRAAEKYRFAHALVREVCYAQLPDPRRQELHRRVARAIEALGESETRAAHALDVLGGSEARAAEVAFHSLRAGGPDDLRRALESSQVAARSARRIGALEDATQHLERALDLVARDPTVGERRRCELLLELGGVQMARGLVPAAQKTHARAAEVAQACGEIELLARAALGFGVEFGAGGSNDQEIALLETALAALPEIDGPIRARVMSRLSRALLFGVRHAERVELAEQALAMARRLGDRSTLATVLYARHQSLWTGAPAEERCAIADEIVQLAEATAERELAMQARALRLGDLLELAALERYRAECASYARTVRDENAVTSAWHVPMQQATLAMLSGQFDDAERLGAEGLALGRRISHQGIEVFHHSVLMTIRYLQGRHSELLPVLRHGADAYPTLPVFRAGLALAHAERGDRLEASLVFERLAVEDFRAVPRDILWVFNLALLSITAHFLRDVLRAKQLYAWLEPYANYNVRVTRIGISSIGSTQHYLGLLATAFDDLDRAVAHFERAITSHRAQGAVPMLANSQLQLARALERRAAEANVPRMRGHGGVGGATNDAKLPGAMGDARRAEGPVDGAYEVAGARARDHDDALAAAEMRSRATDDAKLAAEARARAAELAHSLGIRLVLAELDPSELRIAVAKPEASATAESGAKSEAVAKPAATTHAAATADAHAAVGSRGTHSPATAAAVTSNPAAAGRTVRFRREGPDWVVEQAGRTLRWRNAVGMEMLARLVREPGREFSALDLRGSELVGSDSGELLDAQATQSYRDRAAELREAIELAEHMNDVGRAASAREELEQLEQELRRAIGLGGRSRRAGATYERARISVTKAIRAALRKIAEQDPELGAHLERSVKTGQVCVFSPDPTADVRWEVD